MHFAVLVSSNFFSLLLCLNFPVLFFSSMRYVVIYSRMCFATHSSASSFPSWSSSFPLSSSTERRNYIFKHKIYFGYLNSELWNVKRSRVSFFNFPDGTDSSRRSVRTRRVARAENNSDFSALQILEFIREKHIHVRVNKLHVKSNLSREKCEFRSTTCDNLLTRLHA